MRPSIIRIDNAEASPMKVTGDQSGSKISELSTFEHNLSKNEVLTKLELATKPQVNFDMVNGVV